MTFGVHEQFLDYLYELLQLLSALCSDVKKILYIFTSAFSALNYCSGMFFKSLSYLYEVVHTKFFADFWTFRNFDRNFAKIVAPSSSSNENRNFTAFLKGQSSSNKTVKIQSKSIHKQRHNTCSNYSARTNGPSNSERDKKKHHIFAPTAGARGVRSSPKLCMVIECVETIKKVTNHFSTQHTVFPAGCREKFGVNDRRAVSEQLRNL